MRGRSLCHAAPDVGHLARGSSVEAPFVLFVVTEWPADVLGFQLQRGRDVDDILDAETDQALVELAGILPADARLHEFRRLDAETVKVKCGNRRVTFGVLVIVEKGQRPSRQHKSFRCP